MTRPEAVLATRRALEEARTLASSDNVLVAVTGRRITAILVDLLLDIDPHEVSDPWELLSPPQEAA
jgi:hypothetical protein